MKRTICVLLSILSLCFLAFPVPAEQTPAIIRQIQNPIYGKYDVATYSVTAYGDSLKCTWYLLFEGKEYNISRTDGGAKPWEAYAGETYGATEEKNGKSATFTYTFGGIEPELNDSTVYAVIESASSKLTTDKVLVSVIDGAATPPTTSVPASMEVFKDTPLDLYCQASSPDGSALSYIWYETTTGKLQDIAAVRAAVGDMPMFCIGGVNGDTLPQVLAAGAERVVIVSWLLQQANIAAATAEIIRQIGGV